MDCLVSVLGSSFFPLCVAVPSSRPLVRDDEFKFRNEMKVTRWRNMEEKNGGKKTNNNRHKDKQTENRSVHLC